MVYFMENAIKMDHLGGKPPIFENIHISQLDSLEKSMLRRFLERLTWEALNQTGNGKLSLLHPQQLEAQK